MHRGKVAGRDHDVGAGGHLGQPLGLPSVAMDVAEREQAHAAYATCASCTSRASFSTFGATWSRGSGRTYQTSL